MKVYAFGEENAPVILLLPGTCCHWKGNFGHVIPLLSDEYRVLCVSYDGFDETERTEFPTMLEETAKIEDYLKVTAAGTSAQPTAARSAARLLAFWPQGGTSAWTTASSAARTWTSPRNSRQNCRRTFCCH